MKRLLTFLFVMALPMSWVLAQTFEGTVRWTMKMEITDPKMKAQMEEGQKKMNDPANQEKMKKMQEQMNDPQFKAMMEANPAMKKQMENMMKMQQGGDMNSMMGKGFTVKIKGNNSLTIMEGGMMDGMEILHQKDLNKTVRLDRQNKTYTVMGGGDGKGSNGATPQVKVTKTSETAKIIGYNCTKYLAETTVEGKPATQIFWTTTEIKDFDFKNLASQRMGKGQQPMFYEQIDGVPLKMEMNMPQGNMVMEAAEIKRESLSADMFKIPSDFTETKMPGGY
jgi:hypothetical protein